MSTHRLDEAVRQHMEQVQIDSEDGGEPKPVIGWALVVAVYDPEDPERPTMWVVAPDGAPSFVTGGLLHDGLESRRFVDR